MLGYCRANNLTFIAHGPLGGLKGKRGERDVNSFDVLVSVARAHNVTPHALAIALLVDVRHCDFVVVDDDG